MKERLIALLWIALGVTAAVGIAEIFKELTGMMWLGFLLEILGASSYYVALGGVRAPKGKHTGRHGR